MYPVTDSHIYKNCIDHLKLTKLHSQESLTPMNRCQLCFRLLKDISCEIDFVVCPAKNENKIIVPQFGLVLYNTVFGIPML